MPMPDATSNLTDDDARWLLVRTAASLARLWARMDTFESSGGRPPLNRLRVSDIQASEPWLEAAPPLTAFSGAKHAVILAQGLMLAEATAAPAPDRRRACLIVQHVSCGALAWSPYTLRIASRLGVTLAPLLRDETRGASLHNDIRLLDGSAAANRRQWADSQRT